MERARNQALNEAGALGHDKQPIVGRLHDGKDRVVGWKSADGNRGFRVDYDPDKGVHFNWFDWSQGGRGSGGRWGAETYPGTYNGYLKLLDDLSRGRNIP